MLGMQPLQGESAPAIPDIGPPITYRKPKRVLYERVGGRKSQYTRAPRLESIREHSDRRDPDGNTSGDRSSSMQPEVKRFRAAIVRNKLSNEGVTYLLPVDKTRTSVNNTYRTDMKALFQAPYETLSPRRYNEESITKCTRVHYKTNDHVTRLSAKSRAGIQENRLDNDKKGTNGVERVGQSATSCASPERQRQDKPSTFGEQLNADSRRVLQNYHRLTPKSGPKLSRVDIVNMNGSRSSVCTLPPKLQICSAERELNEQVRGLLRSCRIDVDINAKNGSSVGIESLESSLSNDDQGDRPRYSAASGTKTGAGSISKTSGNTSGTSSSVGEHGAGMPSYTSPSPSSISTFTQKSYSRRCQGYRNYKELLDSPRGRTPHLPKSMMSPHLESGKSNDIWNWLHKDRDVSSFQHFLDVCG